MKIALAGNPNSGKTTLFNLILGKVKKLVTGQELP